ncbi:hypothetical protein BDD43_2831 [Mucilaginibacter gracilis]|uniref:Uncharacterized protein n=1 Tax=Mucilaginibacter gracilis TaxID=423350 RepID=A0A495J0Y4_9SPHI|nr:hypothetical protein [Mucilaginibacter gracilis]RKR82646.1 hypothetical protein BDD43_2831 [Mucilaginibacter gracilis]
MAKNLSQANAALLEGLGENKSKFTTILSAAENACAEFIKRVKANIQSIPDFVNTGSIENLTLESSGNEIHIKGSEHLLYQNYGVKGSESSALAPNSPYSYTDKRPPIEPFLAYIKTKNIRLVHNERYYGKPSPFKEITLDKAQLKLAWAMSTKVFKEGFKPQPIKWEQEKEKLKQDLKDNAKGFIIGKLKTEIYNKYGNKIDPTG